MGSSVSSSFLSKKNEVSNRYSSLDPFGESPHRSHYLTTFKGPQTLSASSSNSFTTLRDKKVSLLEETESSSSATLSGSSESESGTAYIKFEESKSLLYRLASRVKRLLLLIFPFFSPSSLPKPCQVHPQPSNASSIQSQCSSPSSSAFEEKSPVLNRSQVIQKIDKYLNKETLEGRISKASCYESLSFMKELFKYLDITRATERSLGEGRRSFYFSANLKEVKIGTSSLFFEGDSKVILESEGQLKVDISKTGKKHPIRMQIGPKGFPLLRGKEFFLNQLTVKVMDNGAFGVEKVDTGNVLFNRLVQLFLAAINHQFPKARIQMYLSKIQDEKPLGSA